MLKHFRKLFYPESSIHPKYTQYVSFSFLSNILVSAEVAITTHNMLSSINTTSSDNMRTFNYIGKDIIGQVGGLLYMSRMGKKADQNPKRFLLYSNLLQQGGFFLAYFSKIFPQYFLGIAGVSNILSNISFTGFGAVNAKCIYKLALKDNIGEIYSKITVINTIGSSLGLMAGVGIISTGKDDNQKMYIMQLLAIGRICTYQKAIKNLL